MASNEEAACQQGKQLSGAVGTAVLVKGGHAQGRQAADLLLPPDGPAIRFVSTRLKCSMRGKGCMLSTAVAAFLALGASLEESVLGAKQYDFDKFARAEAQERQPTTLSDVFVEEKNALALTFRCKVSPDERPAGMKGRSRQTCKTGRRNQPGWRKSQMWPTKSEDDDFRPRWCRGWRPNDLLSRLPEGLESTLQQYCRRLASRIGDLPLQYLDQFSSDVRHIH